MLANTLQLVYAILDGDTLVAVKATALVVRLAYKLRETEAKTHEWTVGDF